MRKRRYESTLTKGTCFIVCIVDSKGKEGFMVGGQWLRDGSGPGKIITSLLARVEHAK